MLLSSLSLFSRASVPQFGNPLLPRDRRREIVHGSSLFRTSAFHIKVDRHKAIDNALLDLIMEIKESEEQVRQYLRTGAYMQLPVSSYDTAWVAMVPAPKAPENPCFPQCLEWLLENQHDDGSWASQMKWDPRLLKDKLSSTLACVLALKRWNCNEQSIRKGLYFIGSNFSSILDENLDSPLGFNIIFPGMLEFAINMGLDISLGDDAIHEVLSLRDLELKRKSHKNYRGQKEYFAYVAEGLGRLQDWNAIMKYQKGNGSLFDSPSTTAAAFIENQNDKAFQYLSSLVQKFGSSVPSIYPMELYTKLCMVDTLERMGISHYFADEVKLILGSIYRLVLERDEMVVSDMTTCALAFRLLRMNGFAVPSDILTRFQEAGSFHNSMQGYVGDMRPVIEIYKASQAKIFQNEEVLDKLESWSRSLLKEEISSTKNICYNPIDSQEVDYALKFPLHHGVQSFESKRYIEQFKHRKIQMLKTSYISDINRYLDASDEVLELAAKNFNSCQSLYREELNVLERWFKDCKLDQLESKRVELLLASYLIGWGTFNPIELSDARMFIAKGTILVTYVDDLFDEQGSGEEIECLMSLFERLGENSEENFNSNRVEIMFSAIRLTINEMANRAFPIQDRDITNHLVEIWRTLVLSFYKERQYWLCKSLPTVKEYTEIGAITIGIPAAFVPALYFVHTKVSDEVFRHQDFRNTLTAVCSFTRYLNDIRTFKKEQEEKSLNILSLYSHEHSIDLQDAKLEVQKHIDSWTRELLLLVHENENALAKPLREAFWNVGKIGHFLYWTDDEFSTPRGLLSLVDAFRNPINGSVASDR